MALISVRRSIDAYKAVEGGLPASLKELYDAHPFEPAPAGTEYVYDAASGKVGIRRLRDKETTAETEGR